MLRYISPIAAVLVFGCVEPAPEVTAPATANQVYAADTGMQQTDWANVPDGNAGQGLDMFSPRDVAVAADATRPTDANPGDVGPADLAEGPDASPADTGLPDIPAPDDLSGLDLALIVSDQTALNASEVQLVDYLEGAGATVTLINDESSGQAVGAGYDLVLLTRSNSSATVGSSLRPLDAPLIHWEHAIQWSDRTGTTVETSGAPPAAKATGTSFTVDPTASAELRCGFEGEVTMYRSGPAELTYANATSLSADAQVVATATEPGQVTYYAYDRAATLADGTTAVGPRVYFGIGPDMFQDLTDDGVSLLRCAIDWAVGR